mmetsp:Transcript_19676/g.43004  ORF Transcript_19676/g.43004 Transcript_19676/m.43004 type:complete len:175 (+) Transcript_19676:172-696(+)|eukprot:CAMPEP_0118924934 /NCGR_PEP_ID=MMETSP1169-20130426/2865_1 /TAXON_ID=36882 /ORGANISM="Pyramimonas obovata, Strain CCMP722" /LENGTH=174 /DNA_ID=CAMNT_0006866089 /DNA_START=170 /DNA_END=694 /DNA_ORIENTATION=-
MLRNMLQRGASQVLCARGTPSVARLLGGTIAHDGLPGGVVQSFQATSAVATPRLLHNLREIDASSSAVLEQLKRIRILQQPEQVRKSGQTVERVQWMEVIPGTTTPTTTVTPILQPAQKAVEEQLWRLGPMTQVVQSVPGSWDNLQAGSVKKKRKAKMNKHKHRKRLKLNRHKN